MTDAARTIQASQEQRPALPSTGPRQELRRLADAIGANRATRRLATLRSGALAGLTSELDEARLIRYLEQTQGTQS